MINTAPPFTFMDRSNQEKPFSERRYDLDWLRVLAVLLLIYFHAAAVFYQGELGEFYVQNQPPSRLLSEFIFFVHQWHMPLFFLLAGSATWFSLQTRSQFDYLRDRCKRLLIPFVFGTLVLVPPQVYYKLLNRQEFQGSYLQFYPHFFNGVRPQGNFEWAHLWFVIYLFVLTIVALPLLQFLQKGSRLRWLASFFEKPGAIFLPALLLAAIEGALRPRWFGFQNLYDDWADVLLYLAYFVYGFVLCSDERFGRAIYRHRTIALLFAVLGMFALFGLRLTGSLPERGYSLGYVLYQMLRGFNSWCWVLILLAFAQRYLSFNNHFLSYANRASYPVYVLHQTVLVPMSFYIVQWDLEVAGKFFIIANGSLVITIALYDLLIRRFNILRFLFGLKSKRV